MQCQPDIPRSKPKTKAPMAATRELPITKAVTPPSYVSSWESKALDLILPRND